MSAWQACLSLGAICAATFIWSDVLDFPEVLRRPLLAIAGFLLSIGFGLLLRMLGYYDFGDSSFMRGVMLVSGPLLSILGAAVSVGIMALIKDLFYL